VVWLEDDDSRVKIVQNRMGGHQRRMAPAEAALERPAVPGRCKGSRARQPARSAA
jgi:hypothetical protein